MGDSLWNRKKIADMIWSILYNTISLHHKAINGNNKWMILWSWAVVRQPTVFYSMPLFLISPEVRGDRLFCAGCLITALSDKRNRDDQVSSWFYILIGVKLYKYLKINMVFLFFCSLIFTDTCLFVKYVVSLQSKIVIWITHWKFKIIG